MNASALPGQRKITDYFENTISDFVDQNDQIKEKINTLCGNKKSASVRPILRKIFENAERNSMKESSKGHRHDETIKKFATSLFCLVGRAAYEMVQVNIGCGLPAVATLHRTIACKKKIKEGEFRFDELENHLKEWKAPKYVHIHLDDTRIINKVEYDPVTDRFVGFCLPLKDGIPCVEEFVLHTFEELETVYNTKTTVSYAHCIVAQPVSSDAPSFVLFVLGTDSKYNHKVVEERWKKIETELRKRNIFVVSSGADGAGPFLKAMVCRTNLFKTCQTSNVPSEWSFYMMPSMKSSGLCSQDTIHLLAKLRTRLLIPSNILSFGSEIACRAHLVEVLKKFPKSSHGLTQRSIDNKDKQNYSSIGLLVHPCVENCLKEMHSTVKTSGTVIYLQLMRNIRDAFFDKSLSPLKRLYLMWNSIFFLRIWRCWLSEKGLTESDYFVTNNAYLCVELNGHMMINLVYNVIRRDFPEEALRIWLSGSQGCEQLFRLLRSMTPTFSTIVNFSLKGILEKIHKLQFLTSAETDDNIVFPRLKRHLLQSKAEHTDTFAVPDINDVTKEILKAKNDAIALCSACGMKLASYEDSKIVKDIDNIVQEAIVNDDENCEITVLQTETTSDATTTTTQERDLPMPREQVVTICEDLSQIRLRKASNSGLPCYEKIVNPQAQSIETSAKSFKLDKKDGSNHKFPFFSYNGTYIRKTTGLYLLQENFQLSNDRLLRVRDEQPSRIFSNTGRETGPQKSVRCGDLCFFSRVDCEKCLVGRVIQFSYLTGSKKERQYSSDYVDLTKDSHKNIGVLANWFQGTRAVSGNNTSGGLITFKPIENVFTPGYLSMKHYVGSIDDSSLQENPEFSFSIPVEVVRKVLPNWHSKITFDFN